VIGLAVAIGILRSSRSWAGLTTNTITKAVLAAALGRPAVRAARGSRPRRRDRRGMARRRGSRLVTQHP
jgi:hypothetical protein